MNIFAWGIGVPLLLLVVVILKGAVLTLHPANRRPAQPASPGNRRYSAEALESMAAAHIDKKSVEAVIAKGKRSSRNLGSKYQYTDAEGKSVIVFTDASGHVEAVAA